MPLQDIVPLSIQGITAHMFSICMKKFDNGRSFRIVEYKALYEAVDETNDSCKYKCHFNDLRRSIYMFYYCLSKVFFVNLYLTCGK